MISFDRQGLVPAIVQHHQTGRVLMLGYMSDESLRRTRETGLVWFYSRSRQRLWQKGESSGNVLRVIAIEVDCDRDTLLVRADPTGPVCHTGAPDCFFNGVDAANGAEAVSAPVENAPAEVSQPAESMSATSGILDELFGVIEERRRTLPEDSYTTYLFTQGIDKIGKKVGEEAAEVIIAAKNGVPDRIAEEVADLWYHTLVALSATGVTPADVYNVLAQRRK